MAISTNHFSMKHFRFVFVMLALVCCGSMKAQDQQSLKELMRTRGEYYFTLNVDDPHSIQAISEICSVDGTDGKTVVAYANQQEYDRLLKAGYQPNLQTPPSLRANVEMWDGQGTYNWNKYLTYTQYVNMMESFHDKAIEGRSCTLFSLGTLSTNAHRQLLGVRINNGSPEGKPKFLYTSTMHGDEITGMILMLRLIDELCTSTDSQIVNLVNNLDIYIMPLTNPDGTYKGGNNTVNSAQRYNGNNIDLNRNYKDYYKGAHPDGNSYEDETIWTMAMGDENLFTMSANYHGGAEVMNYPWDAVYDDHADKSWYEYVCTEYVQLARQTYSSYMSDTYSDGVTSGAAWYVITGSRQDYMNAYGQCREVTVECSTTKTPSASQLPNFWNYNRNSMLAFMEQCLKGVHGFVYDANTNQPIQGVKVTVQDHDSETSFVTTHAAGDFHRPIKGGSYTFAFEKDGYCPLFVDVTVADGQRVELNDIQLTPGSCLLPDFSASTTNVSLGSSINFTDASYGDIVSWSWTFEGGTPSTSTAQNPTNIKYNTTGSFDVTLTITDNEGNSEILTKEDYINVAESYNMSNTTVTTCNALFYDSGGANGQYSNNLNYTMTFYPGTEGAAVSVNFTQFNTESGYDYLYIYNGTSTSATQIGQYDGSTSPGTVTATNTEGALTFKFISDQGVTADGWVATVSCVEKPEIPKRCYYLANNVSAGSYIMGYLNGNTLSMPSHNNATNVIISSATVTPTDYGFSEEEGANLPQVTLTAYGTNGQYYISYNGRYLARSNYGSSLTWGTSTSQYGRWHIDSNGIYVTSTSGYGGNSTYYLYYNNGSFALSTDAQNNITFYTEGDCPATTIEQTVTLNAGWNWWSTNLEISKTDLEAALGEFGIQVSSHRDGFDMRNTANGNWIGNLSGFCVEKMYKVRVSESCSITLSGIVVSPADHPITLTRGWNWIGFPLEQSLSVSEALSDLNPEPGDEIKSKQNGFCQFSGTSWIGNLETLEPGQGYMYKSNATETKTFTFPSGNQK